MDSARLPDLHSQLPDRQISVKSVGHVGVKRIVPIAEYDASVMLVIDVAVGLRPSQRGAHMSRLIECISQGKTYPTVRDYTSDILDRLKLATPDAASWFVDSRATLLLPIESGWKPVDEICRLEQTSGSPGRHTWGAAYKICLACPQAQAAIAFDRNDTSNIGRHPSHNQVCDLEITVTGDDGEAIDQSVASLVAIGEGIASGPVRELYKRRGEADVVTAIHDNALFAEDAMRAIAEKVRTEVSRGQRVRCQVVNYESIFEYPLRCVVTI